MDTVSLSPGEKRVYDLGDGELFEGKLIDQRARGACYTIRSRNNRGWTVRNVGFLGVGEAGGGANRFQMQVSTPGGGHGEIDSVYMYGKADGPGDAPAGGTSLGGIYVRSSHAGDLSVTNTFIEGFGNNAVYASAVGKDGGDDGSVTIDNCYHRDNTVSNFRIGAPGSVVRNCVSIVDDPDGLRGTYPGTDDQYARGIWGKHYPDQRMENCTVVVSPDDADPGSNFEARHIDGRSHGDEAVLVIDGCHANGDTQSLRKTAGRARVSLDDYDDDLEMVVGQVPTSAQMAAAGNGEVPDFDGGGPGETPHVLEIQSVQPETRANYEITVTDVIQPGEHADSADSVSGSTAQGFVASGGRDTFDFSGEVSDIALDGPAEVRVDGVLVDDGGDGGDGGNDGDLEEIRNRLDDLEDDTSRLDEAVSKITSSLGRLGDDF